VLNKAAATIAAEIANFFILVSPMFLFAYNTRVSQRAQFALNLHITHIDGPVKLFGAVNSQVSEASEGA
jgi:hypothetical protein